MRDDALDSCIVGVGGRFGIGQHVAVVEDIESLVLHRPHVEIRYGDNVEHVEIVFPPEHFFVPAHGAHQCIHGVSRPVALALFDMDAELYRSS